MTSTDTHTTPNTVKGRKAAESWTQKVLKTTGDALRRLQTASALQKFPSSFALLLILLCSFALE